MPSFCREINELPLARLVLWGDAMSAGAFRAEAVNAVLRAAAARIGEPRRWAKGHMARGLGGVKVKPESADAVAFCAYGALRVEALRLVRPGGDARARGVALKLAEAAAKHLGVAMLLRGWQVHATDAPRTVMEWNDHPGRTYAEVIDVFVQALKSSRPARRVA